MWSVLRRRRRNITSNSTESQTVAYEKSKMHEQEKEPLFGALP